MSAPLTPFTEYPDALPIGTVLGDFTVTRVIGLGGFGIVYMAQDNVLHRTVAIKEYLPITIAGRTSAMTVLVRSTRQTDTYAAGLQSFMREARLQARFTHPAMLEVYQVWEQHGTAYMAMRYYPGESLLELKEDAASNIVFDEDAIRRIMSPVFEGVAVLHTQTVLHRDISPDNILIMPSGAPVLLDFGSARMVVVGAEQSLTTVLKPGYAPVEQYIDDGTMEQGPWTDVHALGAVLYFLVMGTPPPQAVTRMLGGTLHEFKATARGRYSAQFIDAVIASLTVLPALRLQSVTALREALRWPDEPPADTPKSLLVTTMGKPYNAEWRAAQMALRTPSAPVVTPAASDAVTVLISSPIDRVTPVLSSVAPAAASDARAKPLVEADAAVPMAYLRLNDRQMKSGFATAVRSRWLSVAGVAIMVLSVTMIALSQHPASTAAAATAEIANPAAAPTPPKMKLSGTMPHAENPSSVIRSHSPTAAEVNRLSAESTKRTPQVALPRTTSPKKSVNDVSANDSVTGAATTSFGTVAPVAPAVAARPAAPRQKSAACQRLLSQLTPSEAAIAQSKTGPLSDCK